MVSVKMNEPTTGTLGKLVSLLDLIASAEQPLRFMDVVKASAQPRGTVHRQISHLLSEGLIEQRSDQTYVVGLRLLGFAAKAWARNDLRSIAAPHLHALHEQTGESVHLAVLRGREVIYLDKIDAKQNIRMHSQVGNMSPAYCTGVGKAALSCVNDQALKLLLKEFAFHAYTPSTLVTPDALMADILAIRQRGFAFDLEEHEEGICCVAAPIYPLPSGTIAAISVTAPAYRASQQQLLDWSGPLLTTAGLICGASSVALAPSFTGK